MSADSVLWRKIKRFYRNSILSPTAGGINPLYIPSMDESASKGFGYSQLGDSNVPVTMAAGLPENFEIGPLGSAAELYMTTTKPPDEIHNPGPNDVQIANFPITQEIADRKLLSFAVLPAVLDIPDNISDLPDHTLYFYYGIRDTLNNTILFSQARDVLIDPIVPGAPEAEFGSSINLNLAAPEVSPSVIDSSTAEVRITIRNPQAGSNGGWRNQQVNDRLTLLIGNLRFVRPPLGAGDDLTAPYQIVLSRNDIGNLQDGEDVQVQYFIEDRVLNHSRLSPITPIAVRIDPNALREPRVVGALNPPFQLDLRVTTTPQIEVRIPVANFDDGSPLVLHWGALTPDGRPVNHEMRNVYNADPDNLIFRVPRVFAAVAAGGTAQVFYEGTIGGQIRRSRIRTITIIDAVSELRPPVIVEANGTFTLDLSTVSGNQINVLIPLYPGQQVGDLVTVTMVGRPVAGSTPIIMFQEEVPPGGAGVELRVLIDVQYVEPLLDGSLTLSYTVLTTFENGSTLTRSSLGDPTYFVVNHSVMYPPATCPQLVGTGAGKFLPIDTTHAVIDVTEASITALGLPLPNNGEIILFTLRDRSSTTPPPHVWPALYRQGVGLSSTLQNADFRPFNERDVEITYEVPARTPTP